MRPKRKKTASEEIGLRRTAGSEPDAPKDDPKVQYWLDEIDSAKKREKDFRKEGERINSLYAGEESERTPFNILFSNTETLLPALYSAVPRPVVGRRFKDDDPLGKEAATAGQRGLEFLLDTNVDGYETYDEGMRAAVLDALLPGRGVTCVKYDAEIGQELTTSIDDEVPNNEDSDAVEDKAEGEVEPAEYKKSELVCVESRSWNRVYFGYAKKWSKMPWVAYEEYIDREEADRLFTPAVAGKLQYTENEGEQEEKSDGNIPKSGDKDERNQGERKTALVYQIWDKVGGRRIRYVSPQCKSMFLREDDDPLQLTGFFNMPRPIQFVEKSNDMMPTPVYQLYENQAKELNTLTRRINRIAQAIKARGIYDSGLGGDIANLMEADDNALVPSDNSASLAAEKGLQNAIWFMPIEQLVAVLMQLYQAREQCKRVIYEITGISDIIRGSTVASETATAQNLKSQWGTLRLKRLQKEVQRYARDLLRMMLEVAATKFSEETWAKMTGLPFLLEPKFNELTAVQQALTQVVQQQTMMVPPPVPGQPPTPQAPSPEMQQLQQVKAELQKPKWADVLALLRDDTQRAYRIDIETNSTIEPEAAEDQKNITEMMNALGQYLNGVGPLVAKGVMPFGAAQSMLLAISRRFRFGTEIEDEINQMQPPKPEGDGGAAEKMAAEKQQMQMAAQQQQKDAKAMQDSISAQAEKAKLQADLEAERRQRALDKREADLALRELRVDVEEERLKITETVVTDRLNAKEQIASTKESARDTVRSVKEVGAKRDAQSPQAAQETELQKAAIAAAAQVIIAQMNSGDKEKKEQGEAKSGEAIQQSISMMAEALRTLAAPKKIQRGKDGRAEMLIPQGSN